MAKTDTRAAFIKATSRLLGTGGYAALRMDDVVANSGAPKGSLYYHFPGGKEELAAAAIKYAAGDISEVMRNLLTDSDTVQDGLADVIGYVSGVFESYAGQIGCPVGALASEAPESRVLRRAVTSIFDEWEGTLRARLVKAGVSAKRSAALAAFFLAAIEGAVLLSKARKVSDPLDNATTEILRILRNEGIA